MFQFPGFASCNLCIQCKIPVKTGGFPHSDIVGSMLVYQLPHTFRRLLRPSSPPAAKASTMCAYSLDHITQVTIGVSWSTYSRQNLPVPSIIQPSFRLPTRAGFQTRFRQLPALWLDSVDNWVLSTFVEFATCDITPDRHTWDTSIFVLTLLQLLFRLVKEHLV